jgi:hypothetical protein
VSILNRDWAGLTKDYCPRPINDDERAPVVFFYKEEEGGSLEGNSAPS